MGQASDWLREERRQTLGDWVSLCPRCGHAQRFFEGGEPPAADCPTCGTAMVGRCGACGARIASMFAVSCEDCGALLREPTGLGGPIRRTTGSRRSRRSG